MLNFKDTYGSQRRGIIIPLLVVFLLSFFPASAYSSVLRLDNSEIVTRSSLVIYGVVHEIRSKGEAQEAVIFVECVLKGKLSPKMKIGVVFSPGMAESPVFEVNERVLLFLTKSGPETFQTTGGFQGKFSFGKSTIQE